MGYPRHLPSDLRFVVHGLIYVSSALAFIGLAVTAGLILGSRATEYRTLSFGVVGIAMLFVVAGHFLLVSFLLRHWRSTRKLSAFGRPRWSPDLWDDRLDGPSCRRAR
jgi:hypothetical protein